jgi:hypothetical protein
VLFLSPQADLTDPTSLPATLVGISAIIDCATARPEESTQKVDWEGKVALIQCAQVRRPAAAAAAAAAAVSFVSSYAGTTRHPDCIHIAATVLVWLLSLFQ